MANVDAGDQDAVVTFERVASLTPRGRCRVDLHLSFLRLQGFKIKYSRVVHLYLLPKFHQPHAFVIISLDPPIRKGQTVYPHIVMKFATNSIVQIELTINEDLYNTNYKDKLELSYKGPMHEVFTTILRGLSGAQVTETGRFRSCQLGYTVKSSLKDVHGLLFPLEKSFFFLPKLPTLILHEEIEYVVFKHHAGSGSYRCCFDLLIRLKSEQEHLFLNIQTNEYHNLNYFIRSKSLKVMNLAVSQPTVGRAQAIENHDDAVEAGGD